MITRVLVAHQASNEAAPVHHLLAAVASEFPGLEVRTAIGATASERTVTVDADDWCSQTVDLFALDRTLAPLERADGTLVIDGEPAAVAHAALPILIRSQRFIARRNAASRAVVFDRVLARHRALHDFSRPIDRARYDHARDVWQWTLRLDADASLPLQLAALFHDIGHVGIEEERTLVPCEADYYSHRCARAASAVDTSLRIVADADVDPRDRRRLVQLLERHDHTVASAVAPIDSATLLDADGLSFFSLSSAGFADYYGREQTKKRVQQGLERMSARARSWLGRVYVRPDVLVHIHAFRRGAEAAEVTS